LIVAEHAPGPWKYAANLCDSGFDIGPCLEDGTLDELAILAFTTTGGEEAEANARLMAASPELLAACRAFLDLQEAPPGTLLPYDHLVGQICSAVARATGGPP
jgi:hypothetical protein